MSVTHLGCPGHFICASDCRWRRHTQTSNGYRISTVGDLYHRNSGKRETLGGSPDSFFETMVFRTTDKPDPENEGCGCLLIEEWCEIDGERYATAGEAQAGHDRYVRKYARRNAQKQRKGQHDYGRSTSGSTRAPNHALGMLPQARIQAR